MLTEKRHAGDFILSEGDGNFSRDNVTIVSGASVLEAGTALGKITASGKYGVYDNAAVDGRQAVAAVLYGSADPTAMCA